MEGRAKLCDEIDVSLCLPRIVQAADSKQLTAAVSRQQRASSSQQAARKAARKAAGSKAARLVWRQCSSSTIVYC